MNIKKMRNILLDCASTYVKLISIIFLSLLTTCTYATFYPIDGNDALIGQVQYRSISAGDTMSTIAQRYDIGYNAIKTANPHVDLNRGFSFRTILQIPTQHLLPNQPRRGIVINLPEMRMYYYLNDAVYTYPIGIGKIGKTIPITNTWITRKKENPTWTPPDDIREFNLDQGIVLPKSIPAGPDNPLGPYAVYMSIPTYLIHSTIFPESVGKRASFGCIRMYQQDISEFFPSIQSGIPVAIVNAPVKIGWHQDHLYIEAHRPLEEHENEEGASLASMVNMVMRATQHGNEAMLIDWQALSYIDQERDGLPHEVGVRISQD